MHGFVQLMAWAAVVLSPGLLYGQDDSPGEESLRDARHELFLKTALGLEIKYGKTTPILQLNKAPVLRYTNPVRGQFNDGEMYVYNDEAGVPRMVVATSLRGTGRLFLEVVSVSDQPIRGKLPSFGDWRPRSGGSGRQTAAVQPTSIATAPRRLLAMRQIARTIKIEFKKRNWNDARLLTQPIHRYEATDAGVVDGALFAFGESNDPEGLLLIWLETGEDKKNTWYWLAAASTSLPLRCSENENPIWEKAGFWANPRPPESPYVERLVATHPELAEK